MKCGNCKYWILEVCCNGESRYRTEFRMNYDECDLEGMKSDGGSQLFASGEKTGNNDQSEGDGA